MPRSRKPTIDEAMQLKSVSNAASESAHTERSVSGSATSQSFHLPAESQIGPQAKQDCMNNSPVAKRANEIGARINKNVAVSTDSFASALGSESPVQLADWGAPKQLAESTSARKWRQFKRWLSNKKLPSNTYRWDTRDAGTIAKEGFQPWNSEGTVSLTEHVMGSSADDGHAVKYESQWVSTGAFDMLKTIDPIFAQQVLNTNLYKIDTAAVQKITKSEFVDVNKYFDSIGKKRPYASQKEWAMQKEGIPAQAIVAWMPGSEFIKNYDLAKNELSTDEASLPGWQNMPG